MEIKEAGATCTCGCHKAKGLKGLLVMLAGLAFLLMNLGVISGMTLDITLSILVILLGLKMMSHGCKCCDKPGM